MEKKQAKNVALIPGCYYSDVSSLNSIENLMSKEDQIENFKQSSIFAYKPFEHTSHGFSDFSASEDSSAEDQIIFDVASIPLPEGEGTKRFEKAKEWRYEGGSCGGYLVSTPPEAELSSDIHTFAPEIPGRQAGANMPSLSPIPEPNLASPETPYFLIPKEESNDNTATYTDFAEISEPKFSSNDHNQDLEYPEGHPGPEGGMAGIKQVIKTEEKGNESLDEADFSGELLSSTMITEKEADVERTTEAKLSAIRKAVSKEKTVNKHEESILETKHNQDLESGELEETTLEAGQLEDNTKKGLDLEDGEVSSAEDKTTRKSVKKSKANMPICKFYMRGACVWNKTCRFRHPEPLPNGKYQMFDNKVLPVAKGVPVTPKRAWKGFIEPSVDTYQSERFARPLPISPSFYFNDTGTGPYYSYNQLEMHERAPLLPTPTFIYIAPPPPIHHYPFEMELPMRRQPAPPLPSPPKRRSVLRERRRSSSSDSEPESPPSSGSILVSPPRYLHSSRRSSVARKPSPHRRKGRPEPKRRRFNSSSSSSSLSSSESDSSTNSRRVKSSKDSKKGRSNNSSSRHRERHRSQTPEPSSSKRATPGAPKKSRLEENKSESAKKKQSRQEYLLMKLLKVEQQIAKKKEQNRLLKAIHNKT
ncbi:zinc finger CCCH domain-containing protein 18 isoform X1 [Drosophila bipectinata]|uniref:zinc finger CCCH domain-containing protein 18 isoform X1 n=1 Tax=Drosophila bipectinata TaxID=42026 RepID=UPI0038B3D459